MRTLRHSPLVLHHAHPLRESSSDLYVLPTGVYIPNLAPPPADTASDVSACLYIDAARFLPDCATISRVVGRVYDQSHQQIGQDMTTNIDLDSDLRSPSYSFRLPLGEERLPPTAVMLVGVYCIDVSSKQLSVLGYVFFPLFCVKGKNMWEYSCISLLPSFLSSTMSRPLPCLLCLLSPFFSSHYTAGSTAQPMEDSEEVCLREGGYQLRVYRCAPPQVTHSSF